MEHWSAILSKSCDQIDQLKEFLRLSDADVLSLKAVQETFPILINPYYLSLIDPDDPDDPVRKMCIPSVQELDAAGSTDTSGEKTNTILPGLQHKYAQTALLLSTHQCAMNCRHCFRRRMVGISDEESVTDIGMAADYIREHREITNVLISGGDAFMNSNETVGTYLSLLCSIPHLDFIRFGTRTPVVLPQRITTDGELKGILAKYAERKQIYVVTQFNHPRELTAEAKQAITELTALGIPVRNQTVLLKGINDNPETLSGLLKSLTAAGKRSRRPGTHLCPENHRDTVLALSRHQVPETAARISPSNNGCGRFGRDLNSGCACVAAK